jgi:hypothetical protein
LELILAIPGALDYFFSFVALKPLVIPRLIELFENKAGTVHIPEPITGQKQLICDSLEVKLCDLDVWPFYNSNTVRVLVPYRPTDCQARIIFPLVIDSENRFCSSPLARYVLRCSYLSIASGDASLFFGLIGIVRGRNDHNACLRWCEFLFPAASNHLLRLSVPHENGLGITYIRTVEVVTLDENEGQSRSAGDGVKSRLVAHTLMNFFKGCVYAFLYQGLPFFSEFPPITHYGCTLILISITCH